MLPDLAELPISQKQLEQITGLDVSDTFVGRACRPSLFRQPQRLLSFLLSELLTLGLILIFCLPSGLVIARSLGLLSSEPQSTVQFLITMLAISLGVFGLYNAYLWQQTTHLRGLCRLLDEVDRYNEMIAAIRILDELETVNQTAAFNDRSDVLQALQTTRESLLCALMTEKILRKHKRFLARKQELLTQLETNLVTLQTLQLTTEANDYGQLLNDALQIALAVKREVDRLNPGR
jgi:predicted nucleic acid-binding protein